jgi:DtxR family manganese transport transcriptional regulator
MNPASDNHRKTREEHSKEIAEDYVEAIAYLIELNREARVTDLATQFGVSHVTVTRTLQRLEKDGLITTRPYRSVFLTDKGVQLAKSCRERHDIVLNFLTTLGVPQQTAERDTEGIEHHVSEETLKVFKRFIRKSRTE